MLNSLFAAILNTCDCKQPSLTFHDILQVWSKEEINNMFDTLETVFEGVRESFIAFHDDYNPEITPGCPVHGCAKDEPDEPSFLCSQAQ